ncbi:MAG: hemerythrin domain-containing protein [Hyphomonadaceae bacterium]|nr:hemerythrin domain-containing protein [Hyphomonadaceae bacterium]
MNVEVHVGQPLPYNPGPIERSPPALLKEPLEFLFAEHYRHRHMCKVLEYLSIASGFEAGLIASTDDFIRYDLALHVIDEEEDLFPLLRRRCSEEDDIEDVLGRLSADHALDQALAKTVRTLFAQSLEARVAPSAVAGGPQALLQLARQEKSHMALENAVVMPLARRRLTSDDLEALSLRLAARRGVTMA